MGHGTGARLGRRLVLLVALTGATLVATEIAAQSGAGSGAGGNNRDFLLRLIPVPEPSNLNEFVLDKPAAIRLGKALFWDMQTGSDGMTACATCHYKAGADNRTKNQLNPNTTGGRTAFTAMAPNRTLTLTDFPFRKLTNVDDRNSTVVSDNPNVTGSQGQLRHNFLDVTEGMAEDVRERVEDKTFNVRGVNVRRVTGRNAPTVINSVFMHRQFHDGRALNIFNGVTPFGALDTKARVYRATGSGLDAVTARIDNASLASQATGPPLSDVELSAAGRTWPHIGRKVLSLRPLAKQHVRQDDSVLGLVALQTRGLSTNYVDMIKAAFQSVYWSNTSHLVTFDANGLPVIVPATSTVDRRSSFTQMEANFSLFWGLSIQLYEATLVSDQAPIDRFADGDTNALTEEQRRGLRLFQQTPGTGTRCSVCHSGALASDATVDQVATLGLIRTFSTAGGDVFFDTGFHSLGTRPDSDDAGAGGLNGVGAPVSLTRLSQMGMNPGFSLPSVPSGAQNVMTGRIKTPQLRNVELTGPYMHTGSFATLMQIMDFYNRGGDFNSSGAIGFTLSPLGLSEDDKKALVAFLKAFTDERVRRQSAPFDHPQIFLPRGSAGDELTVTVQGN